MSGLKGPAKSMYEPMREQQLDDFASTAQGQAAACLEEAMIA